PKCGKALRVPAAARDENVGRVFAGYTLSRLLGKGAMAAVYEGEDGDRSRVAVKLLDREVAKDEELLARFQREAQIAVKLAHPSIVGVLGGGEHDGVHYLVMELVEGGTYEAMIDSRGRLPWREAAQHALQIARALEHASVHAIVHRDLKPGNILIAKDGTPKLADLGFAKNLKPSAESAVGLTMAGAQMGSPGYMAPEQVTDAKNVSAATDIYGLGATFYHAVCGETPFVGKNAYQIMEKVIREPPTPPRTYTPELPAGLCAFLLRTLAKDRADRPQNATAFIHELEQVLVDPEDVSGFAAARAAVVVRRRGWIPWSLAVLALVAIVGVACWLLIES
nr:serine/threonine protein kinase [Planctomycetota bacterium]